MWYGRGAEFVLKEKKVSGGRVLLFCGFFITERIKINQHTEWEMSLIWGVFLEVYAASLTIYEKSVEFKNTLI